MVEKHLWCITCQTCPDKVQENVKTMITREWNGEEYEEVENDTYQKDNIFYCYECGTELTEK